MALRARLQVLVRPSRLCYAARRSYSDFDQSSSGAIRQAGGAFGRKEQAVEDQYFKRLQQEQLEHLREEAAKHHEDEIEHHEEAIHDLEAQIKRHQKMMGRHKTKLDKHVSEMDKDKK